MERGKERGGECGERERVGECGEREGGKWDGRGLSVDRGREEWRQVSEQGVEERREEGKGAGGGKEGGREGREVSAWGG